MGVTPTRLPAPPRAVKGGAGCAIWFVRLFILPHMAIGVMLILQCVGSVLIAAFGVDANAIVTKAYTSTGSKGGTSYRIAYRYTSGGREHTGSETVNAATYAAVSQPDLLEGEKATVRVRYLNYGFYQQTLMVQDRSPWRWAGMFLLIGLFWNGILSVFVVIAWVIPIRARRLVKYGEVTAGAVVSSRVRTGKNTTHYVTFRFSDPQSGAELQREMTVPRAKYESATPERPVTVIYWPGNLKRAIAYELSDYTVEGALTA